MPTLNARNSGGLLEAIGAISSRIIRWVVVGRFNIKHALIVSCVVLSGTILAGILLGAVYFCKSKMVTAMTHETKQNVFFIAETGLFLTNSRRSVNVRGSCGWEV